MEHVHEKEHERRKRPGRRTKLPSPQSFASCRRQAAQCRTLCALVLLDATGAFGAANSSVDLYRFPNLIQVVISAPSSF